MDADGNTFINTMISNLKHANWKEHQPNKDPPSGLFFHPADHLCADSDTPWANCAWVNDFAPSHLLPIVIAREE
jgi:hypothetical protein